MVETSILPKNTLEHNNGVNGAGHLRPLVVNGAGSSSVTPDSDDGTLTTPLESDQVPPICAVLGQLNETTEAHLHRGHHAAPNVVPEGYVVYKWRWYVLAVVAMLNCFNTLSWIAYAPVANHVDEFYGADSAFLLTTVFLVACVPVGLFSMWSVRRFGLRSAVLVAAWANGIGSVIRVVSSFEMVPMPFRYGLVLSGQVVAACAYPFIMFLPTKTAAAWFPDTQRTVANSLTTLSNPLGVLLAMVIAPLMVTDKSDVLYLNILVCGCCVITTLMATVGVRTSAPKTPPTRGAAEQSMAFGVGVRKLVRSRSYLILFLSLGAGIGMFNSLYGMMQQILCARGYSNTFAGLCCVLMIVSGFAGAFGSAVFVDKTKKFEETMKVAFTIAVLGGILFALFALKSNQGIMIAVSCCLFGFCGLAAYPIGLEMSVECSFPVAETTSSGLIVLSGQIQGFLFLAGMRLLRSPLLDADLNVETCSDGTENSAVHAYDMTVPLLAFCFVATLIISFFILAFRPKLRRLKLERDSEALLVKNSQMKKKEAEDQEMIDVRAQRANAPNSPLA